MIAPRRIVFADRFEEWSPPPGVLRVVLDPAWTPGPQSLADTVAARQILAPILDRADVLEDTFQQLDAWADALDIAGRMTVDGVSWWYRRRLGTWLWLVERVHWCAILAELFERVGVPAEIEVDRGEPALAEMAAAVAKARGLRLILTGAMQPAGGGEAKPHDVGSPVSRVARIRDRLRWAAGRASRRRRHRERERRSALLAARVTRLRTTGRRRVAVLTNATVHQVIAGSMGERRIDPFLGSVVERLRDTDICPIVIAQRADWRDDEAWPAIESDPLVLPDGLLATRWADAADDEVGTAAGAAVDRALADVPGRPLELYGIDLAPAIVDALRTYAIHGLPGRIRVMRRAARMIADLGISALVLINEYGLTEWVAAGRAAGVAVVAVQHGIIVPQHVGYRHRRVAGLVRATRTLVFGPYEARVLMVDGGYRQDEVEVVGAPRLDVVREPPAGTDERAAIRSRLGVRAGDRLIVLSTTSEAVHRRFYWPHALARLLDGPLPGVHLVFKLHPAEHDDGSYRALVEGLALAGGYQPPPITSVRDIDLLALLRAADAHVGLYSTVLTDAVTMGTPNLIAATQARTDLLGYVAAGVARPIRGNAEFGRAIAELSAPDADARRAFQSDHFLPGDSTARIVRAIERLLDTTPDAAAIQRGDPDPEAPISPSGALDEPAEAAAIPVR